MVETNVRSKQAVMTKPFWLLMSWRQNFVSVTCRGDKKSLMRPGASC